MAGVVLSFLSTFRAAYHSAGAGRFLPAAIGGLAVGPGRCDCSRAAGRKLLALARPDLASASDVSGIASFPATRVTSAVAWGAAITKLRRLPAAPARAGRSYRRRHFAAGAMARSLHIPLGVDVVEQRPHALVEVAWVGQMIDDGDESDACCEYLSGSPLTDAPALPCLSLVCGEEPHPAGLLVLIDNFGV